MRIKNVLRFYYSADSLERAIDNLITGRAYNSAGSGGEECAEKICELIGEKSELSVLYNYLDGVITTLPEAERCALENYAVLRGGVKQLGEERIKLLKRAVMKFVRRARRLASFKEGLALVGKYYCLLH